MDLQKKMQVVQVKFSKLLIMVTVSEPLMQPQQTTHLVDLMLLFKFK
jgi:hypothetical protein